MQGKNLAPVRGMLHRARTDGCFGSKADIRAQSLGSSDLAQCVQFSIGKALAYAASP
jgi:hypothetical protein